MINDSLEQVDPEVFEAICNEGERQESTLELIASENIVSVAVMEAQGSLMTNKYAEGYPGRRYYGGCEHVDVVERLAVERARDLFGAEHVNVQPHSGTQANMAVYFAVLNPGDTYLGMDLSHGGHLSMEVRLTSPDACTTWCPTACRPKRRPSTTMPWPCWRGNTARGSSWRERAPIRER